MQLIVTASKDNKIGWRVLRLCCERVEDKKGIPDEEIYTSSDPNFYDYVRESDFTKNTGIKREDFHSFSIKELLDNACDFLERYHNNNFNTLASISLRITLDRRAGLFHIMIGNSNNENVSVFNNLNETFNYKRSWSSKNTQYKITRGAQGDAVKRLGTMGYMMQGNGQDWPYPIVFRHNKRVDKVYIQVDRKNGKINPRFENSSDVEEDSDDEQADTSVSLTLPAPTHSDDIIQLIDYCKTYTLFNTHLSFKFHFSNCDDKPELNLPALHPIPNDFSNPNSIYCYTKTELTDLLNDLADKNMSVYDAISRSGFREVNQKDGRFNRWKDITLTQLTDPEVSKLHDQLRKSMLPMSKLHVPYDTKVIKRKEALIARFNQIKPRWLKIDTERAVYARTPVENSIHKEDQGDDNNKRWPFIFEALAIPIKDRSNNGNNYLISGINNSTSPTNRQYFRGYYTNEYVWTNKKTGQDLEASDIEEIIRKSQAGVNISDGANVPKKNRKVECVLITHLAAPRLEYRSYGKSSLVLTPFTSAVPETIEEVISKLPAASRYTGLGKDERKKIPSAIGCLRLILEERWDAIRANKSILNSYSEYYDPWSQSTVWYHLREEYLLPLHIPINDNTRDDITAAISEECEKLGGHPKREDLGIFASPRATMYFRGRWHDVDIKQIPVLAGKGTDVIFVEKRGVIEQLKHIGDKYGIAFVNTQGHFAEYPKELVPKIIENGGHVIILTDFDCAGIHIAEKVINELEGMIIEICGEDENSGIEVVKVTERVKRIGIDIETLDYFAAKGIEVETKFEEGKPLTMRITSRKQLQRLVEEPYPENSDLKKQQQPGLNVVSPMIEYLYKYVFHPAAVYEERYKYIATNFAYLTGINDGATLIEALSTVKTPEQAAIGLKKFTEYKDKKKVYEIVKQLLADRDTQAAKRIELDSVIKVVKANLFGEFLLDKLKECFPHRNYNRAIELPTNYFAEKFYILPNSIRRLLLYITELSDAAAGQNEQEIRSELKDMKGLLSIDVEEAVNEKLISEVVAANPDMKALDAKCEELLTELPEVKQSSLQPSNSNQNQSNKID